MAHAEVGDDVYGEDPTVNRLEAVAAERLGKEAAVFVPSGTMGNLAALLAHCGRGDEAIIGDKSHTFLYEQGGMASLGGIVPHTVPNQPDGTLLLDDVEAAVRPDDEHFPRSRLVCLENTHNACFGTPLTAEYTAAVADVARRHGLKLHVDGARLFNAAAALGVPAAKLVREADSVTFCLSKGLSAPVGSVLCGDAAFIAEARRARKALGGAMRQAGVLAAAGLVALERLPERLPERLLKDHERARRLTEGLATIPGVSVFPVHTNIVYFQLTEDVAMTAYEVADALKERGVLIGPRDERSFRAVTHLWVNDEDVERVLVAMREVVATGS
jgi:threonine aldolase